MRKALLHCIVYTVAVSLTVTAMPVQAQTPSLVPASGCIGFDGTPLATCPAPFCIGFLIGGICLGFPVPSSCDFHSGLFLPACVPAYIAYLIRVLFSLTGAIFLLMIILGGYQYVVSKVGGGGGEEGKARVRYAIIGFILCAISFFIVDFVLSSL